MTPEPRAMTPEPKPFSRRQLLKGAGAGGIAAALVPVLRQSHGALDRLASFEPATSTSPDGTPEQVHLTWEKTRPPRLSFLGRRPDRRRGHASC